LGTSFEAFCTQKALASVLCALTGTLGGIAVCLAVSKQADWLID